MSYGVKKTHISLICNSINFLTAFTKQCVHGVCVLIMCGYILICRQDKQQQTYLNGHATYSTLQVKKLQGCL